MRQGAASGSFRMAQHPTRMAAVQQLSCLEKQVPSFTSWCRSCMHTQYHV